MPSPLRSPKTLADWFELDYFRRRRLFRGLWRSATAAAVLACGAAVAWTLLPANRAAYQAGPVATAHALFGHDCGKCHTESFSTWSRLWHGDTVRSVPDSACLQCHDGPPHHDCVRQRSCAGCHHEHRGRSALARVADHQCTSCHADLRCDDGGPPQYEKSVTGFAPDHHPEFRLLRPEKPTDPGTLRFNHKLHLDGVLAPGGRNVKLECQACHEMDAAGRYARPINYDRHCKECHPLSVRLAGDLDGPQRESAREFSAEPAPHPAAGETVESVRAALRERLTRFILRPSNKGFLQGAPGPEPERPLPGWLRGEPVPPREFAWVNRQLAQVERVLFDGAGGCRHCHQEKTTPWERDGGLPEYEPPGVPDRWYVHSVFRHGSHQAWACTECHAAGQSTTAKDVLMPRVGKCQECHHAGGARADCAECHGYHDPDLKRKFRGTRTIDEFLSGANGRR